MLRFGLAWIVLPNLPFAVLSINYCSVRTFMILVYVLLGLAWRAVGPWIGVPVFVGLYIVDVVFTLADVFGLPKLDLFYSIPDVVHLDVGAHLPYIGLGLFAAAACGGTVAMALKGGRRSRPAFAPHALLAAFAVVSADVAVNRDPNYGLKPLGLWTENFYFLQPWAGRPAPDSAVARSGIEAAAKDRRSVLVVMVESLGSYRDEAANRALVDLVADDAVRQRYQVATGTVPFFGSTTAGELRELCARDDSYGRYREALPDGVSCLPGRLRQQGYETVALHGFTKRLFDRGRWYPVVGFDRLLFLEEVDDGRLCGVVFKGHCDDRMAAIVRRELQTATPRLVYWLTLDSHFPLERRTDTACAKQDGPSCLMLERWTEVLREVRRLALDPSLPPTDILIVGDHAPPLFSRKELAMFDRAVVPWISLTPRPDA